MIMQYYNKLIYQQCTIHTWRTI